MEQSDFYKILIVDDNAFIHKDFIKILNPEESSELDELDTLFLNKKPIKNFLPKLKIDTALQGEEGFHLFKKSIEENNPYALAFIDIRMPPGWDGIKTIKHIWEHDKDIQIVICTAHSDYSWEETISHLGHSDNFLILKKPFDNVAVRQLVFSLTKKWRLIQSIKKNTSFLEQKINEKTDSLQHSLSLVKATLESSQDGIVVVHHDGNIVDFNQNFLSMWDLKEKNIKSYNYLNLMNTIIKKVKGDEEKILSKTKAIQSDINGTHTNQFKLKNGYIYEVYTQPQILSGKPVGRVWSFRDLTKRIELEESLQYQAHHDSLTGLKNRVFLFDFINHFIQNNPEEKFALLFFDLDRFKLINDSLTHAGGDKLLQTVSNRLGSLISSEDHLIRLGGDEFVIFFNEKKSSSLNVETFTEKILNGFSYPFSILDKEIRITTSIGISIYPKNGSSLGLLLKNADSAMYFAKEKGGNQFQFYHKNMNSGSLKKLDEENEIKKGLHSKEFFLFYQPQINIKTNEISGVEALIRWQHPKKGIIYPKDFIGLSESSGLILEMGEWVLNNACQQHQIWRSKNLKPIPVAVNISAQQIKQNKLIDIIKSALKETKMDPAYLEIELSENIIISHFETIEMIKKIKELGVKITLDDFGTGYSNLSYLKKIPLDRIKIDQSFIKNIYPNNEDDAIIKAIIAIAKSLKLELVAEGVENYQELKYLQSQNCDHIQGFYFSEPISSENIETLLEGITKLPKLVNLF